MNTKPRKIPGTNGATAEACNSIDRIIRDSDGTILGTVSIFSKSRFRPYRIVRTSNCEDTLGYNLTEAVETLRARKANA